MRWIDEPMKGGFNEAEVIRATVGQREREEIKAIKAFSKVISINCYIIIYSSYNHIFM